MRYIFIASLILTFSCGLKRSSPDGVNFIIKDKEDTLSQFFYSYYQNYYFMNKEKLDSVIFDKEAQKRIPGIYLFGFIEKERYVNRLLTFRGDSNLSFTDFNEPTDFFLHEEYELENYEVIVYNDYIDSTTNPILKHQILAALNLDTKDTLLFQELNILQKPNYVSFSLLTYETWEDRDEMYELLTDVVDKMKKSTKPNNYE